MQILTRETAPRYIREGIVGHLLASPRTCDARNVATSLVEIARGGEQRVHSHVPEQVYFIIDGTGMMTVGDEQSRVGAGDCIYVPSDVRHGLRNVGDNVLRYLGIVCPSFSRQELEAAWPDDAEAGPDQGNANG